MKKSDLRALWQQRSLFYLFNLFYNIYFNGDQPIHEWQQVDQQQLHLLLQ